MKTIVLCGQNVRLFGVDLNALRMDEAVGQLLAWLRGPEHRCRYVVTPNINHVVLLQKNVAFQRAYANADLVLADGAPLVFASRLLRKSLPERVAGSDLVPALLEAAHAGGSSGGNRRKELRLYLLGAAPGVAEKAAQAVESVWTTVRVVGTDSPPFGFENDAEQNDGILSRISAAGPDLLIVGLGAPKQELWVHRHVDRIEARVAVCAGATIDFLAGDKQRAPRWMRRYGLEWLHRVATEPGRLLGRYVHDACFIPLLIWREVRGIECSATSAGSDFPPRGDSGS